MESLTYHSLLTCILLTVNLESFAQTLPDSENHLEALKNTLSNLISDSDKNEVKNTSDNNDQDVIKPKNVFKEQTTKISTTKQKKGAAKTKLISEGDNVRESNNTQNYQYRAKAKKERKTVWDKVFRLFNVDIKSVKVKLTKKDKHSDKTKIQELPTNDTDSDSIVYRNEKKKMIKSPQTTTVKRLKTKTTVNIDSESDVDKTFPDKSIKAKDVPMMVKLFDGVESRVLRSLDDLQEDETDEFTKRKINDLKSKFKKLFESFVKENKDATLKSDYGSERLIINTVDTSTRTLNRMFNSYLAQIKDKSLRSDFNDSVGPILGKIIKREYNNICDNFGLCVDYNKQSYVEFIDNLLTRISTSPPNRLNEVILVMTNYLVKADLQRIMDTKTHTKMLRSIKHAISDNPDWLTQQFSIFLPVLKLRNQPIELSSEMTDITNTLAIRDILFILDRKIKVTESKVKAWNDQLFLVKQWNEGKYKDTKYVFHRMLDFLISSILPKLDSETSSYIKSILKKLSEKKPKKKKIKKNRRRFNFGLERYKFY